MVLSPRVPKLTAAILRPAFAALIAGLPPLPPAYQGPADFDWAMHPGGATILTGAERELGITPEHMRASYDTYMNHGNSSSATIFTVLDRLRAKDMDAYAPAGRVREYIVGCAFGPGITVEVCMLKRNMGATGLQTPPETESEASRSEVGEGEEVEAAVVGQAPELDEAGRRLEGVSSSSGAGELADDDAFINEALGGLELD